ncbi:MAG: hypothetical protein H7A46_19655 [Verrucomicrobiales bacterium]|nr:hypothetical protein [Verrucomicrobiales bacterium]
MLFRSCPEPLGFRRGLAFRAILASGVVPFLCGTAVLGSAPMAGSTSAGGPAATEMPPPEFLASETSPVGTTGTGDCDPDGVPDDWGDYSLLKQGRSVQTSVGEPEPDPDIPFVFVCSVQPAAAGPKVTQASVTLPGGKRKTLAGLPLGNWFLHVDLPATLEGLEAACPPGSYTLSFTQEGEPQQNIPMTLPAGNPPMPHFTNYEEAQGVDATRPFLLQWDPFTGAVPGDELLVQIEDAAGDRVFLAPNPCVPRELPVEATSVEIPPGALAAEQTYTVHLAFVRRFYSSTDTVPEMSGDGAISFTTAMALRTVTGGVVEAAQFTAYRFLQNGHPEMTLQGTPGADYTVQRTSGLGSGVSGWADVGAVTLDGTGVGIFEDPESSPTLPLFYRAIVP